MAETILVVDDEPQFQEMHAAALGNWGYEYVVARDGFEALLKVAEHSPDLIVSDLRMCRMSGFELLSVIRRRYPEIPVLCVSGDFEALNAPHVICDAFMSKGAYDLQELRAKIIGLLSGLHRPRLLKDSKPVVWVPKDVSGYYVVTCTNCLRSFSVRGSTDEEHSQEHTPCIHCQTVLTYFIEGSRA